MSEAPAAAARPARPFPASRGQRRRASPAAAGGGYRGQQQAEAGTGRPPRGWRLRRAEAAPALPGEEEEEEEEAAAAAAAAGTAGREYLQGRRSPSRSEETISSLYTEANEKANLLKHKQWYFPGGRRWGFSCCSECCQVPEVVPSGGGQLF